MRPSKGFYIFVQTLAYNMAPMGPHTSKTPWSLPHPSSRCSTSHLFSLTKYKKETEAARFLDNWGKWVSWALGLALLTQVRLSLLPLPCVRCLCCTRTHRKVMNGGTDASSTAFKLWLHPAASHPASEGSAPSFLSVVLGDVLLGWFQGSSLIAHVHIMLLWILLTFPPAKCTWTHLTTPLISSAKSQVDSPT